MYKKSELLNELLTASIYFTYKKTGPNLKKYCCEIYHFTVKSPVPWLGLKLVAIFCISTLS